jgi:hypothetical protein
VIELTYSFKIDNVKLENDCRRFGYIGTTQEELFDFYHNIIMNHLKTWNQFFPVLDENGDVINSYTFNEVE